MKLKSLTTIFLLAASVLTAAEKEPPETATATRERARLGRDRATADNATPQKPTLTESTATRERARLGRDRATADNAPPQKPTLTEATASRLQDLAKLLDEKDFTSLFTLTAELFDAAPEGSFDRAILSRLRGQIHLNTATPTNAIPFLETSLQLSAGHPAWFDAKENLDLLQVLSQLYYQEAIEAKDQKIRKTKLQSAITHIHSWLAQSTTATADIFLYLATLLYTDATLNPEKVDTALLREAIAAARESLVLRDQPDEQSRLLIVAAQQQLRLDKEVAETLEQLVAAKPANVQYWRQLFGTYASLASAEKNPSEARRWQVRALLTQERAAAAKHTPAKQEELNTIALLFSLQQYENAANALEKALAAGTIESTTQNWELLASAWRQQGDVARAIAALRRGTTAHPADAELRLALARLLYSENDYAAAHAEAKKALATNAAALKKPAEAWFLLAWLSYELQQFEDASRHAATAAKQPGANTAEIARFQTHIENTKQKNTQRR